VTDLLKLPISLTPVILFLTALVFMDSFKLVSIRSVVQTILVGALVAVMCYFIAPWLTRVFEYDHDAFVRYIAPPIEEVLKAVFVVFLVQSKRVGFIVDAAIYGFAVGAGFAVVENILYAQVYPDTWIVRGFGTAIMHGSTTAIFAVLSKGLSDRHPSASWFVYLLALVPPILFHSLFNHFPLKGWAQAALIVATMPLAMIFIFEWSEKATRHWLGTGFDTDVELLEVIGSGRITESRVGMYLQSLKGKFSGQVVGDMLSMLQTHLELSLRARGILLAREAGIRITPDETVKANLKELKFLEKSVGKTGMRAMTPFLNMTSRDLWQLYMLGK
jgi:RsiW-degrading membrane proteinase PrsW (M82 family)